MMTFVCGFTPPVDRYFDSACRTGGSTVIIRAQKFENILTTEDGNRQRQFIYEKEYFVCVHHYACKSQTKP